MTKSTAGKIAAKIITDLKTRMGLDQTWESIEEDIQDEIKKDWIKIILKTK